MKSSTLKNAEEMNKHLNSFHFILDTVSAQHDINAYLVLLKRDGNLTQVGVPAEPLAVQVGSLIYGRRSFSGSLLGASKKLKKCWIFAVSTTSLRILNSSPFKKSMKLTIAL